MASTAAAVQAKVPHHLPHPDACLPSPFGSACRVSVISGGQLPQQAPQQSRSQVLPQHSQQQAHPQTRAGLAHPSQAPQGPSPPTLPARGQAPQPAPGQAQRPLPPPPSQLQRQSSSAQHGGVAQGQQQQHRGSLEQSLSQVMWLSLVTRFLRRHCAHVDESTSHMGRGGTLVERAWASVEPWSWLAGPLCWQVKAKGIDWATGSISIMVTAALREVQQHQPNSSAGRGESRITEQSFSYSNCL